MCVAIQSPKWHGRITQPVSQDFISQAIEKQLNGSSTNEQETNTTSLHSLPEHTFVNLSFSVFLTGYATGEQSKTEHIFASDTSISTDLPRDSWAAPGHIYGNFSTQQPPAPQTQPINKSRDTREEIERRSRVTNKMVYSLSLCSLFCLLLFTSNSDAVHPSAVYRSFHQNDHFTVPSPNSTLSAQCKAAYDKLRNPNSSDVTELVACKFVRSACVFRYQRQSRVPIHLCHWLFAFCYLILQYKFLPDSTVRNGPGGAGWAGTQAAHK